MAYQSINPFNERPVASFPDHTDAELGEILSAAERTFREDWRDRSFDSRKAVFKKAAATLRDRIDHFATLATSEMGKLLREARVEVLLSADILDYYADHAQRFLAPRDLDVEGSGTYVESAPIGPIFCIEPWNFPYYQLARVVAPNLMAGNTIVMKHAPGVPQCALAFEALLLEAGAPHGTYSNVFISNEQAAAVVADGRIRGVALTGSERAGTAVAAAAGKALKKSTMELGGSDAFIVLDDANMDLAVRLAVTGRMMNTGQACTGSKRFVVMESVADAFVARFRDALEALRPGDPMEEATTLGPLVSRQALDGVLHQIDAAVEHGAEVLLGGKRLDRLGYFLAPTLLAGVRPGNPAYYQEFFAPVAMVFRVADEAAAITLANDSPYGLASSVISSDTDRAKRVASRIEAGMVFINAVARSAPELPFGGVKNSGFGRELSDLGISEFVNKKLVQIA